VFQLASEGRRYFWWPDSPEDKTRQKVLIHSEGAIVERKGFNQEDVRHISDTIGNLALDRKE
jgi:hypothetical protein